MVVMAGRDTFRVCVEIEESLAYSASYYPA